jgi:predicted nucleic acid-binding protein
MKDKLFFDTNLLIYHTTNQEEKSLTISKLLAVDNVKIISTQVLKEYTNVLLKKKVYSYNEIENLIKKYLLFFEVFRITENIILKSLKIKEKYGFSFYDSLIIMAALDSNCTMLLSEDLQHQQIIENKLTIYNPFAN